ncbi:SGNH/GDSL hydrolase family protein [Planktothrix pseudagardhii]|uniref:AlgX/AlgJ SGNH hydrolase-like domain-containing protein n=1 Tax=Planktothrix pseudagardhii TaxID=132604 RepID=A0A9W4CJI4_9CYAN|nr:SGNH/GDSL hydrolase family protein [Planktothrix pseudagardhii]CAD5944426.1 hypothetical protein NO713_02136 [Planktothrix pseudagardhii]
MTELRTKLKSWTEKLLLMMVGVIAGLLIIETLAISTGFAIPPAESWRKLFPEVYQGDARLDFKPKPNLENFEFIWKNAGVSEVIDTDRYGFRNFGRDYTTSNLYFVGDSFTWGQWVNRDKTFYGLIESELQQPVITLGVPAYGFEQYEVLFQDWVVKYQPKIAVLSIFANDLHNIDSRYPLKDFDHFIEKINSQLSWYKRTFLYQFIFRNYYSPNLTKKASNGMRLVSIRSFDRKPFSETGGIGPDIDYLTSNTHLEVEAALSRIIDLTQEHQIKLLVFLIPSKESTYIQEYTKLFPNKIKYIETEEIGYERLCNLAKTKGVTCVDLTEAFRQNSEGEKLYFDLDNHWNVAGHQLASRLILGILQPEKDVDSKTNVEAIRVNQFPSLATHEVL